MAKQIELAEAQFTGFSHREKGYPLVGLVESMGLTKKEWHEVKERGFHGLSDFDVAIIDSHF